jgi:hypothetical protein
VRRLVRITESGRRVWDAAREAGVGGFIRAGSDGVLTGRTDETGRFVVFEVLSGEYSFGAEWG